MTYRITDKVPIVPSRIRTPKYPFWDMDVGDSFYVPRKDANKVAVKQSCFYASRLSVQRKGKRWRWRIVDEREGVRVFRVE